MIAHSLKPSLFKRLRGKKSAIEWKFISPCRRVFNQNILTFWYALARKPRNSVKLHLGCGSRHHEGYINIDLRKTGATDLVCDIRRLPYRQGTVEIIETYHVIEHLGRHDLPRALKCWHRVLRNGGKLIIECPDFEKAVEEYVKGDSKQIDSIFGLQRFPGDFHLFGYGSESLKKILEEAGFREIVVCQALDYHAEDVPCIRVECEK